MKIIFFIVLGCFLIWGCKKDEVIDIQLATMYAKFLLLHEKEKSEGQLSDSLYQQKVKILFAEQKISEESFKERISELQENPEVWRKFFTVCMRNYDSLKVSVHQ